MSAGRFLSFRSAEHGRSFRALAVPSASARQAAVIASFARGLPQRSNYLLRVVVPAEVVLSCCPGANVLAGRPVRFACCPGANFFAGIPVRFACWPGANSDAPGWFGMAPLLELCAYVRLGTASSSAAANTVFIRIFVLRSRPPEQNQRRVVRRVPGARATQPARSRALGLDLPQSLLAAPTRCR
jgi:hypothetical protein